MLIFHLKIDFHMPKKKRFKIEIGYIHNNTLKTPGKPCYFKCSIISDSNTTQRSSRSQNDLGEGEFCSCRLRISWCFWSPGHFDAECTQRNLFGILLNQTKIRLYLLFFDWFGNKRTSVWFQINRRVYIDFGFI